MEKEGFAAMAAAGLRLRCFLSNIAYFGTTDTAEVHPQHVSICLAAASVRRNGLRTLRLSSLCGFLSVTQCGCASVGKRDCCLTQGMDCGTGAPTMFLGSIDRATRVGLVTGTADMSRVFLQAFVPDHLPEQLERPAFLESLIPNAKIHMQ